MGSQTIRQQARRAALDAQSRQRAERAARDRRVEDLALQVLVALHERDEATTDAEQRAGAALTQMIEREGLSAREAVQWCGRELTVRDVTRLRRLAAEPPADADAGRAPGRDEDGAGDEQ